MKALANVYAVGARSPLGLDALSTALMLRTGLPAITGAPLAAPGGGPLTMAYDRTQDPLQVGEERAGRLAIEALRELARMAGPAARGLRLRAALAFPEARPGQPKSEVGRVLMSELRTALRETFGEVLVDLSAAGSAGLAYVLPRALSALAAREVDAIIVGGAHSDYDPLQILALDVAGRLFTPERIDGTIPGECAAFALLGRDDLAQTLGLSPLCRIHSVASAEGDLSAYGDASSLDPVALTAVIRDAAAGLPEDCQLGWAIGDHGFEAYRTRELYAALTRTSSSFCPPIAIDAPRPADGPPRRGRASARARGRLADVQARLRADAVRSALRRQRRR